MSDKVNIKTSFSQNTVDFSKVQPMKFQFWNNPFIFNENMRQVLLVAGFFFGATIIRWIFKSYAKSEFDYYPSNKMIEICKFCQIIKDQETILYKDDQICAFTDVRPLSCNHILVIPLKHIRNINTLENNQETLDLIRKMNSIAQNLIKEAHDNDVKAYNEFIENQQKQQQIQDKGSQQQKSRTIKKPGTGEYVIGFHRSFATSIDHIHMHVFELPFKSLKTYYYKTNRFFFMTAENLIKYLETKVNEQSQ